MLLSPVVIRRFQKDILRWYEENKRDLPWRRTRDPYRILVSEIMLQQTQVARVIPKYEAWLAAFPTIEQLAKAKTRDALHLWSGLGYNRRALYLQKAAEVISAEYGGVWPKEIASLTKLPGIGKYTAGAIACFSFDQQVAVVDTNIRKVILTSFSSLKVSTEKELQEVADQLLPKGKAYEWNQALMDYASAMLKKEKIPIKKQSRFVGSDRYYRGKIIRLLLEKERMSTTELAELLKSDAQGKTWLTDLLEGMERRSDFCGARYGDDQVILNKFLHVRVGKAASLVLYFAAYHGRKREKRERKEKKRPHRKV